MSKPILICGVDEAGRGPLCGSVVAAAVILDPLRPIEGLDDSKKLSSKKREALALLIRNNALSWAIAQASVQEIDHLNILHATMLAMKRAVESLNLTPTEVLIDGNRTPQLSLPARAIVGGDALEACISAASILAKTHRDEMLVEMDKKYPNYGFAQHKGYGTAVHMAALAKFGATPEHRKSFAPVKRAISQGKLF